MKFGKELLRAVAASESIVSADNWLDYKVLKKMLKKMPNEPQEGVPEAEKIMNSDDEREFFRALASELRKVETRFAELKSKSLQLAHEFSSSQAAEETSTAEDGDMSALQERLSRCASAHLFVLLVENYAVLNYCGFTKILKKHDKLRATHTKVKYMSKMVNERNFAKFDDVRTALEQLEHSFEQLSRLAAEEGAAAVAAASCSSPIVAASPAATWAASPSAAAASTTTQQFDAQRRELVDINNQGMDRLKSLVTTALLSLEEHENHSDDTDGSGSHDSKRLKRIPS